LTYSVTIAGMTQREKQTVLAVISRCKGKIIFQIHGYLHFVVGNETSFDDVVKLFEKSHIYVAKVDN
jgi:hypothetical protein